MPTRNYFQGLQALMPIDSVDFLPTIGNLPIPCLQDAYKDLQCMFRDQKFQAKHKFEVFKCKN